jgi:tetratricopeptide (TPR) repeat protein
MFWLSPWNAFDDEWGSMRCRLLPRASVVLLLALSVLFTGCDRESSPAPDSQVKSLQLSSELDRTKKKLVATEKELTAKDDAVVLAKAEADKAAQQVVDKDKALGEKDAAIKALEKDIAEIKKQDAFAYLEVSKLHQQNLNSTALDRYRQFVAAFPKSPLVADANRAIAELTVTAPREARARVAVVDPHAADRDIQKKFNDGQATLEDLLPMLKKRSVADVVKLLGAPNMTYRDGTELGYVDRVIDLSSGSRATLVIGFEDGVVSTLRLGYQGRPVRP